MIRSLTFATAVVGLRCKRTAPKTPIAISSNTAMTGAIHGLRPRGAQIAFDHREPIDHMAERVVDGL